MVSNSQIPDCVEHNHLAAADIPVCWTHTITNLGHLLCNGLRGTVVTGDTCVCLKTKVKNVG